MTENYEVLDKKEALFTIEDENYDLRFNMQKVKMLEAQYKTSLMAELAQSQGVMSFHMLEGLFSVGLFNATAGVSVKGKKAQEIFAKLLEENGYSEVNVAVINKLQEDLGFLFR